MESPVLQSSSLPSWHRAILYAAVALMPISMNAEKIVGSKSRFYLSPFEPLLALLLILAVVDILRHRERLRDLKAHFWLTFPVLLWALWAALSCLSIPGFPGHGTGKAWARGVFNPLVIGLIGTWVFVHAGRSATEIRRLSLFLLGSVGVCALLALKEYLGPVGQPFDPSQPDLDLGGESHIRVAGWYDFRGLFGAQMALAIPAATAFALLDKDSAVRGAAASFAVIGLCVTLHAGGFAGSVAGMIAVLAAALTFSQTRVAALVGFATLAIVVAVALPKLPRNNPEVLARNLALYDEWDGKRQPTARLRRYQSVLDLLSAPRKSLDSELSSERPNWITGVGAGRYQENVKRFYQPPYDKPVRPTDDESAFDRDADEPFTFGFLETVTVELGAPGLLIVLLLFATWCVCAASGFSRAEPGDEGHAQRMVALAALGAGVGALVLSVFGNPAVRGVGGTFVFFLAAAIVCRAKATAAP
ncbi:MAG TPA: hypothetical protein VEJ63_17960 [Planctomycetota bacterium]|nr:hypothetical protein [Planctomycetota bacterium]